MADWDVVGTSTINSQPGTDPWSVVGETQQVQGPMRIPAMIASNAAKGLAHLAAIPGDINDALDTGLNAARSYISPGSQPISTAAPFHVGSADVDNFGSKLGLWNRPDLEPQSPTEKYIAAGSQGAGASIPAALTGGASAIPALVTGAASGVGSQAGQDMAPNYPTAGAVLGGLAGGLGAGGILKSGSKVVNAARGVGNDMTDAYKIAGVTPRLAGDVTQNPTLQGLQAFASKTPMGAGRVATAAHATADEFGNSAENVASNLGSAKTPQDVGTVLQGTTAKWMQNFKAKNAANWGALDGLITNPVKVDNYSSALDSISKDLPKAPATAAVLQPGLTGKLADALRTDLGNGDSLPWQTVKGIRTRLGEMLEDPNLPADTGTAELKRLYGGLTSDMKGAAAAAGPQAQDTFTAANTYTKNGHNFIDGIVRPLIRQGQTPEGAASTILSKLNRGGTSIGLLRDQMPDAADEVAAYKVRDMASAADGRQNAAGNAVSPSSFLTDWNKLDPNAKAALFPDPAQQSKLAALAKISEGVKGTLAKVNSSNTAAHGGWQQLFETAKNIGLGVAGGHHFGGESGAFFGGLAGASPPLGGYFASHLTSSPALTSYLAAPGMVSPLTTRMATGLGTYANAPALNPPAYGTH